MPPSTSPLRPEPPDPDLGDPPRQGPILGDPWSEDLWDRFPGDVEPRHVRLARREARSDATSTCLGHALDAAAVRRHHPSWASYLRTQKRIAGVPPSERVRFAGHLHALVLTLRDLARGDLAGSGATLSWSPGDRPGEVELEARGRSSAVAAIVGSPRVAEVEDAVAALFARPPIALDFSRGEFFSVAAVATDQGGAGPGAHVSLLQIGGLYWTSRWLPDPPRPPSDVVHLFDDARPAPDDLDAASRHRAIVAARNGPIARHGLCFDPLDWGFALDGLTDARLSGGLLPPASLLPSYRVAASETL